MKRARKDSECKQKKSSNLSEYTFPDCQTSINLLLFHCRRRCGANREKKLGAEWCHRVREGKEKPARCIKVSVSQIEDSYLGRNNKEKEKKKCVIKKRKLYLFDRRFTGKAAVRWRVLDLLRRDVWFACTSIQPSPLPVSPIKPSGFFKRAFIKVSKHSSQLTALCCNKTVFTVSVPELMRLNGWRSLSAETKQISCSENL